jgi:hypothetical protein
MCRQLLGCIPAAHSWAPVTHACNPSYLRGRDQEDHGSKPARANSFQVLQQTERQRTPLPQQLNSGDTSDHFTLTSPGPWALQCDL